MATFGIPYPITRTRSRRIDILPMAGILALAVLSIAGTELVSAVHVPLPGPLLAAGVLVVWLTRRPQDTATLRWGDRLIAALPLLFVPLVVQAFASLRSLGPVLIPFLLTIAASTLAALAATIAAAKATTWLSSRSR